MRAAWQTLWGCARGPVSTLAPQTRLLAGILVFAVCMVSPVTSALGAITVAAGTLAWLGACRPPRKVARAGALFGLALFLPYFLLAPLIRSDPAHGGHGWARSLEVPWSLFSRGLSGMLVSLGAVTNLNLSDLREGLLRLPVPRVITAVLLQILHQTATLVDETAQVSAAMAVRGASGGRRTAWRVLSSLPQVWLPRVMLRAENVAAAMELRGFSEAELRPFGRVPLRARDGLALLFAAGLLALAAALRWGGGR